MRINEKLKEFWKFLNKDSWQSTIVFVLLVLIFIMFIFSPLIGLLTGFSYSESTIAPKLKSTFPFVSLSSGSMNLVIVESCSMYHSVELEDILTNKIYSEKGISLEDTEKWNFQNGFTKGDIIFSIAPNNLEVGDVIIFNSGQPNVRYPIIHRIIRADETFTTKGDNNQGLLEYEKVILPEQVLARSAFRIPYVGWIKLFFFEWQKPQEQRGLCK